MMEFDSVCSRVLFLRRHMRPVNLTDLVLQLSIPALHSSTVVLAGGEGDSLVHNSYGKSCWFQVCAFWVEST